MFLPPIKISGLPGLNIKNTKLLVSIGSFFVIIAFLQLFTNVQNVSACCHCNWSFCIPGGSGAGSSCIPPNPNYFFGGQYNSVCSPSGLDCCTDTSTCGRVWGSDADTNFDVVSCSACDKGYGWDGYCDFGSPQTFGMCVQNCSGATPPGGSGCSPGAPVTEVSCQDATGGATNGLWARYNQWIGSSTENWRLVAQGIYPLPGQGTNGYLHGYEVNTWPTGWEYFGDIQLLPGVCPHWMNTSVQGYVEIDAPGTYQVVTSWWNIYLQIWINNVLVADTSSLWSSTHETDSTLTNSVTFPSDGVYPRWFPVRFYLSTNDYGPGFRLTLNGTAAGSTWYNGPNGQHVYIQHTRPCDAPPSNTPPSCTISGPLTAVATYPLQYSVTATDPDSNLNAVAVNYSLSNLSTPSWASPPIPTQGFSPAASTSRVFNIPGLSPGTYYVGCNAYDSASARCSFNPWCEWPPSPSTFTCGPSWVDCAPEGAPGSTDYIVLNVTDYISPWFQASGGNVVARGNVSSTIPSTAYNLNFIRDPVGLLIHSGTLSLGSGVVSTTGVAANASVTTKPQASFDLFFNKKLPADIKTAISSCIAGSDSHLGCTYNLNSISASSLANCNEFRGYKICYWDGSYNPGSSALGNLTLTGNYTIADGDRVILFVDNAELRIQGSIRSITRGRSSFLVVSEGGPAATSDGIIIEPTVGAPAGTFLDTTPDLEGVFYTDKSFVTTHTTGAEDRNLHIRGSVVADSFNLRRDLGSGSTGEKNDRYPAEYFEYGTEQVMAFPPFLRLRSTSWSEVAP